MSNDLAWLQDWYRANCDGDWEHSFGVRVETVDNPGWFVNIDLKGTRYASLAAPEIARDVSDDDWLRCSIKEVRFEAAGDPSKLEEILRVFRAWMEGT